MNFALLFDRQREIFHIGYNVPAGKLELVAEQPNRQIGPGRPQICVNVLVDGALYGKKTVGLNVRASGPVLVATQAIRANEPVSSSNTRIEHRDITNGAASYLTALAEEGTRSRAGAAALFATTGRWATCEGTRSRRWGWLSHSAGSFTWPRASMVSGRS